MAEGADRFCGEFTLIFKEIIPLSPFSLAPFPRPSAFPSGLWERLKDTIRAARVYRGFLYREVLYRACLKPHPTVTVACVKASPARVTDGKVSAGPRLHVGLGRFMVLIFNA